MTIICPMDCIFSFDIRRVDAEIKKKPNSINLLNV